MTPPVIDPTERFLLIGGQPYEVPGGIRIVNYKHPNASVRMSFYDAQGPDGAFGSSFVHPRRNKGHDVKTLDELKEVVHMIVVHTDCCYNSAQCFMVLKARQLSTHLMIDWDGTVYQATDIMDQAIHAVGVNKQSVGIDMNNVLPNMARDPVKRSYAQILGGKYAEQLADPAYKRQLSEPTIIQGGRVQSYGYTDAQYRALAGVVEVLSTVLPRIKKQHPMDASGRVIPQVVEGGTAFEGIIAHWHTEVNRWDPGPGFDWDRLYHALRGEENVYPIKLNEAQDEKALFNESAMAEVSDQFYRNNEQGRGGYYPLGINQQWHGGIHLHVPKGTPVRAMLSGTVVAAHFGPPVELGSNNFVVLRHEVPMPRANDTEENPTKLVVYSLMMHLDAVDLEGKDPSRTPEWLRAVVQAGAAEEDVEKERLKAQREEEDEDRTGLGGARKADAPYLRMGKGGIGALRRGEVAIFDWKGAGAIRVGTGAVVGWSGEFGDGYETEPMLHVELFADGSWRRAIDLGVHARHWVEMQEDVTASLHANAADLLALVGARRPKLGDGGMLLPRKQLRPLDVETFYQSDSTEVEKTYLRRAITRHVSEWSDEVDWVRALSDAQDWRDRTIDIDALLRGAGERYRDGIFSREIRKILPFVWLTKEVAEGIGLDVAEWNGVLYHFHPIWFLQWLKFHTSTRVRVISKGKSRKELQKMLAEEKAKADKARAKQAAGEALGENEAELLEGHGAFVAEDMVTEDTNPREVLDDLRSLRGQGQWRDVWEE